jgi:arsenate reductase-like glutaredoxin family protein
MISGRIITVMCAAALAAALTAEAQTNVYRWVDKDGKVHFSDSPPPPEVKESTTRRMGGGGAPDAQLPFTTREAMKRHPITLFTSPNCGELCANGRALLSRRGIPFSERDAESTREDAERVKALIGGLQVPVLLVGDRALKGYNEETWNAALDGAGYARAPLPGQSAPPVARPAPAPVPAQPAPAQADAAAPQASSGSETPR